MKTTYLKDLNKGLGSQKLWELDEKMTTADGIDFKHVVSSAISSAPDHGGCETFVFPADSNGEIIDWGELAGSQRGTLDHDLVIKEFCSAQ